MNATLTTTTEPFTIERAGNIAAELSELTGNTWQVFPFRSERHTLSSGRDTLSIGTEGRTGGLLQTYGLYSHNGKRVRASLPGPCTTVLATSTDRDIAQDIVARLLRVYRFYLALAIAEASIPYQNGSTQSIRATQNRIKAEWDKGNIPDQLDEALEVISEMLYQ